MAPDPKLVKRIEGIAQGKMRDHPRPTVKLIRRLQRRIWKVTHPEDFAE